MENCNFILKTINDKIAEQEGTIKYYREETSKKDDTIRELETKLSASENLRVCNLEIIENLKIENEALKEANEELRKKLNDF